MLLVFSFLLLLHKMFRLILSVDSCLQHSLLACGSCEISILSYS